MYRSKNSVQLTQAFVCSIIILLLLIVSNLVFGSVTIGIKEVVLILFDVDDGLYAANQMIIYQYRLPQSLTALFAGAALAVAGLMMQTLFKNPLADPSILGISSGASLGVALLLLSTGMISGHALIDVAWLRQVGIIIAAAIGAMGVLVIITLLSKRLAGMVSLLIAGIMISYIAGAIVGMVKYFSQKEDLQAFVIWGMGSFSNVGMKQLPLFISLLSILLITSLALLKPLNMMLLGDQYAFNLGLNIRFYQRFVLLIAGLLTAIVTAYAGPIAFIGLAVPHLARNLFKNSDHKILLPATMLTGASLALACNLIARLPGFDGSLPINSITSLVGAPFVIWIIVKRQRFYSS